MNARMSKNISAKNGVWQLANSLANKAQESFFLKKKYAKQKGFDESGRFRNFLNLNKSNSIYEKFFKTYGDSIFACNHSLGETKFSGA